MAVSNYKLCNLAARLMRAHIRIAQQAQSDPSLSAVVPPTKDLIAAAKQQLQQEELASRQPITIDCGTFEDEPQEAA
jgi:hypothetical protein